MEQASTVKTGENQSFQKPGKSGGSFVKWVVVIVLIALIIVGGLYAISKYSRFNVLGISNSNQNWQAVFLTNGQVYFGKVTKEGSQKVILQDIYYLQVTQPLQTSGEGQAQAPAQNELSLVKLGNELHGPQDQMRINTSQVLFIEDLKSDSRVVEAINNYKSSQNQ
jgi:hypothetical protein